MRNERDAGRLSLFLLIAITIVLGGWLTTGQQARAERDNNGRRSLKVLAERIAQAKLSLDQAILDAEKTTGGKAIKAGYELEGDGLEISVKVLVGEKLKEVEYDAMTGKVSSDDDEHEGDDDSGGHGGKDKNKDKDKDKD